MTRVMWIGLGVMLVVLPLSAQGPAGRTVTFSANLQEEYATLKDNLTKAADTMPESSYSFKPGSSADLRTFGELIGHQADHQFTNCAIIKGVPSPVPAEATEKGAAKSTKAQLAKALAQSFAFCDGAISTLTDQNALQMIKQADRQTARGAVISALLSHGHGSSNVMAVYLRAKGIARPW